MSFPVKLKHLIILFPKICWTFFWLWSPLGPISGIQLECRASVCISYSLIIKYTMNLRKPGLPGPEVVLLCKWPLTDHVRTKTLPEPQGSTEELLILSVNCFADLWGEGTAHVLIQTKHCSWVEISMKQQQRESCSLHNIQKPDTPSSVNVTD